MPDQEQELTFDAGTSSNTPLTPNSNAVTVPSGNANDDTQISFMYNNMIPYWAPQVSSAFPNTENDKDRGNAVVTFMQGLTVEYLPLSGGYYTIIVNGKIKDSGSTYNVQGKSLGTFPQKDKAKT
ncbi:MAG TPA: hypothetical protein VJZ26_14580 [Blastocatellia bacterium]|nr:hypothetical protein [Blastocatellia bacterium]